VYIERVTKGETYTFWLGILPNLAEDADQLD
jgi:hypothetical protein